MKTLKISEDTHRMLCAYGTKGETFDEIIKRLIQSRKKNEKKNT